MTPERKMEMWFVFSHWAVEEFIAGRFTREDLEQVRETVFNEYLQQAKPKPTRISG